MAAPPENVAMIQALDIVGFAIAQQGPNNINPAWEFAVHCGLEELDVMVGIVIPSCTNERITSG